MLTGQVGSALLSAVSLAVVLTLTGRLGLYLWGMIGALVVLRILNQILRKPRPVLITHSIAMRSRRVIENELLITAGFMATIYLVGWPIDRFTLGLFAAVNITLNLLLMLGARLFLSIMGERARTSWKTGYEKQALVIGTGPRARKAADMVLDSPEMQTLLIGFIDPRNKGLWRYRDVPFLGKLDALREIIATCQIDAILIAVEPDDLKYVQPAFDVAEQMGVTICFMPEMFGPKLARVRPGFLKGLPILMYRAVPECRTRLFVKGLMDRIGALVGVILSAPLMLAAAIAIKLDSRGPVLFKQVRSGLNGKPFSFYKFRTMVCNAEDLKEELKEHNEMSGPVFKIKDDPRITRVGRILRKYSIDEFPQFFNVLKGDMSLVGPRPPLPKEVAEYEPWQHRKLSVRPGVTCLWQINGRNKIDFEDWMKLDLEYIDNWSLWQDAKILARTVPAVLKTDGAS